MIVDTDDDVRGWRAAGQGSEPTLTDAYERPAGDAAAWEAQAGDPNSDGSRGMLDEPARSFAGGRGSEIERAVPAGQQLADSLRRVGTIVRSSVPLRTLLFVLPPLALPFALGLSLGAAFAVALLLLWLAGAAAVLATMMFDGGDQLALRSIERRLEQLAGAPLPTDNEALMAIGAQLDTLSDGLDALVDRVTTMSVRLDTMSDRRGERGAAIRPQPMPDMHHRPQEHWSSPHGGDHNELHDHDHDVVPERSWSRPEWQR